MGLRLISYDRRVREIKPLYLLFQGLFTQFRKGREGGIGKIQLSMRNGFILAEYDGKIMSAVSGRDIKYNNYFGARKGYFGLAATLSGFGSKELDS